MAVRCVLGIYDRGKVKPERSEGVRWGVGCGVMRARECWMRNRSMLCIVICGVVSNSFIFVGIY